MVIPYFTPYISILASNQKFSHIYDTIHIKDDKIHRKLERVAVILYMFIGIYKGGI